MQARVLFTLLSKMISLSSTMPYDPMGLRLNTKIVPFANSFHQTANSASPSPLKASACIIIQSPNSGHQI